MHQCSSWSFICLTSYYKIKKYEMTFIWKIKHKLWVIVKLFQSTTDDTCRRRMCPLFHDDLISRQRKFWTKLYRDWTNVSSEAEHELNSGKSIVLSSFCIWNHVWTSVCAYVHIHSHSHWCNSRAPVWIVQVFGHYSNHRHSKSRAMI